MESNIDALVSALGEKEWQKRQSAAESLGKMGEINDPKVIEALTGALGDHVFWVRRSAAEALGRMGDANAVDLLLTQYEKAPGDGSSIMRLMALENLGFVEDARSFKALVAALKDDEPRLVQIAVEGLARKQEPYALFDLQETIAKGNDKLKPQILKAMEQLKADAMESLSLEKRRPVCTSCLTRFTRYKVKAGFMKQIAFFGCRQCGLTRYRMDDIDTMVAVLDAPWEKPFFQKGDRLLINMAMRDRQAHLVDFDWLAIRNAPGLDLDDQVQHIIRKSGNDAFMDPKRLKTVPVRLVNDPSLTQNTLNLIKFKFKGVAEQGKKNRGSASRGKT